MRDIKFIIVRDKVTNLLRRFKSDNYDHYYLAKLNGYDVRQLLETGMIVNGRLFVLECYHKEHREKIKHSDKFVLNDVNKYLEDLTNRRIMKAREIESRYKYRYAGLREGD